ncbi:ATPase, T2SS/T4P/T4SS family [Telmatospirillum sp.]|uniref:ATPase, T2SS/T4P/T4SS family n=1 Tax=Telmatospirillum sp. TaxID=2079197 RepID=UPI002847F791|nr:ATPase, T2SS/T4P/T4SS family [Telmatospirillum sp.]MDR3440110.1 ATPase, T2SS/T4P/T4SS family [Telmatospirillum sp.]
MNPLLEDTLRRLAVHYAGPDVEEVAMNRPGEVWVKMAGGGWQSRRDPALTEEYVLMLCQQLANVSGQIFHRRRMPLLYTTLPEGHRFTAVVGPNVRYEMGDTQGVALNIRVFNPDRRITLDRYGLKEKSALAEAPLIHGQERYDDSPLEDLLAAVRNREAILISGATSTGKTTFLNAIMDYLPSESRVLTVEDAREVIVPHDNRVHLVVSRTETTNGIDFMRVVDAVVRMTPDVIVCGEIGIANAPGVFRLMTTGHTNFMATIHANSPEAALRAFYQNLAQTNPGIDAQAAIDIVGTAFGRIVQIDRHGARRVVTAIDIPRMLRNALEDAEV